MTVETMREAMDHLRTDTDDVTGATAPVPTDEELTTAVALLAQSSLDAPRRPPPGWWVVGILAAFILFADVGILVALTAQKRVAVAQCERVNDLRAADARRVVAQEASIPAERYDAATRDYYNVALADLVPTNCAHPGSTKSITVPNRMPRGLGQPPPLAVPGSGAAGETGESGVPGLVGADGKDGAPGTDGKDGAPGVDGIDGTGADGIDGTPGADGAAGQDGTPGPAGPPGPPGMDATTTTTTTVPCLLLCPPPPP